MTRPIVMVIGQAGYGKTRWLMERVAVEAPQWVRCDHQRLLALSVMHGARRRVDAALSETCPSLPRSVMTLDGFALSLVNRWRRGFGIDRPFTLVAGGDEVLFGVGASFDETLIRANELIETNTVRRFIAETYPLVVIDEFQDCHGRKLDFVKALSTCSRLLLAADDFQLLDADIVGCPAVEWVSSLADVGTAEIVTLETPKRTVQLPLLNATQALRANTVIQGLSVPFIACPRDAPAAFRILERLALGWNGPIWRGSCAILTPSHDIWTQRVLASIAAQAAKRKVGPVYWTEECSEHEECEVLHRALGVNVAAERPLPWEGPAESGMLVDEVVKRVSEIQRARDLTTISRGAVAYIARRVIHAFRTRGDHRGKRVVTTIHGAKNREFEHIFLLWPFRLPPSVETQRRLLYNGLSRARTNAMLLMLGDLERGTSDPVLSLVGAPRPAFAPKKRQLAKSQKRRGIRSSPQTRG